MNNPFIEYQCVSITICDTEAIVVYQNDISKKTFGSVVGRSLFDCHPPINQTKFKKEIVQIHGLIENSMVIPEDMPH